MIELWKSPPFLKGDLGGLSKPHIIPPAPLKKKGGNGRFFPAILLSEKNHIIYGAPHFLSFNENFLGQPGRLD
jgi:hypothetical protein